MNMHVLCAELADCLNKITEADTEMGILNQKAVALQAKMQALQVVRRRIEVDLTQIKLEVL